MKQYKVKDVFGVLSGSTPSTGVSEYWNGALKWITPKDLSSLETATIEDTERRITTAGFDSCSAQLIPKGSVIISSRAPIGYVAVLEDEMSCNQGCKALVPKEKIDPFYVYYLLRSKKQELNNMGSGSTFKELSKSKLEDFPIRLPEYNEQKEIAHILSQADKARQQRNVANGLAEQFLQATFLSLFGDPVRNEKRWEVKKLETLYSNKKEGTKCGPFGSALKKHEYVASGVPVWVMDNIVGHRFTEEHCLFVTPNKFSELKSYGVKDGDIIISRAGTVGKMCVVHSAHSNSIISTNLIRLSLNEQKILPIFFVSLMSYFGARVGKLRTGGDDAFTHMNTGILNSLEFPLPPLKLQQQFAAIVAQTEALRQRQQAHAEELEGLFQGLLQQYFEG